MKRGLMNAICQLLSKVEPCDLAAVRRTPLMGRKQFTPVLLWGWLLMVAPLALAQTPGAPLSFGNNFFVTGDYVVAGAYGMNTNFTVINKVSYTTGIISVPDVNPGITGVKQVPKGAQIVAALLYWQTIEKSGLVPGAPGSGQNWYFRPLLYSKNGGPAAPGYAISGTSLGSTMFHGIPAAAPPFPQERCCGRIAPMS